MIAGSNKDHKRPAESALPHHNKRTLNGVSTHALSMHDIEEAFYNKLKMPPLFFAVFKQNLALVIKLLQMGQSPECAYTYHNLPHETTALQLAAKMNNLPILEVLLENGANPNIKTDHMTLLNYAIDTVDINVDIVAALIKHRSYLLRICTSQGKYPKDLAEVCNNIDKIEVVMQEDRRVGSLDPFLHISFIEEAFNNKSKIPPLFFAVLNENLKLVKQLLQLGLSPNCGYVEHGCSFETTVLALATRKNNIPLLTVLLENNTSPMIKTDSNTILNYAIQLLTIKADIIATIIKYHPSLLNICTNQGRYPVHLAASSGNLEKIKIVVEEGGNVDALSLGQNFSPVWLAVDAGNTAVTQYLVEQQADLTWYPRQTNIVEQARAENGKHSALSKFLKSKMNFSKTTLEKIKEKFLKICDHHLKKAHEAGKKFLLIFGEHHGVYKTSRLYKALIPLLINKGIHTLYCEEEHTKLDTNRSDPLINLSRKFSMALYGVDNQRYKSNGELSSLAARNAEMAASIKMYDLSGILIIGAAHMEGLLAQEGQKIDPAQFYVLPVNLDQFPSVHKSFQKGFWIASTNVVQLTEEGFSTDKEVVKRWNPT